MSFSVEFATSFARGCRWCCGCAECGGAVLRGVGVPTACTLEREEFKIGTKPSVKRPHLTWESGRRWVWLKSHSASVHSGRAERPVPSKRPAGRVTPL